MPPELTFARSVPTVFMARRPSGLSRYNDVIMSRRLGHGRTRNTEADFLVGVSPRTSSALGAIDFGMNAKQSVS